MMNARMKFVAMVVAVLGAALVMPASAIATDPYEPNDSPTQATPVQAATDYYGSIDTIVDQDWYVFYSPGTQQVVVNITSAIGGGPSSEHCDGASLELVGPDGQQVYPAEYQTGCEAAINVYQPQTLYFGIGRGRYYVHLSGGGGYGDSGPDEAGSYDLRLVPSDRFVSQAYLDALNRLDPAQQAVNSAQRRVTRDLAAIKADKAGQRHSKKFSRRWRTWHRKLLADQSKLAIDRSGLKSAQTTLANIQSIIGA